MKPIQKIKNNPTLSGLAELTPDLVYSHAGGKDLTLRIIKPWWRPEAAGIRFPLIVFVQGSAWTFPNVNYEIPQLARYAQHGYVVATVTHRNSNDGFPFPAFLEDVKCAVRYLRAHADEHRIDPERVAVYGTSSGGNTALLLGLTGDDARYKTDEYADYSDAVSAVVECFGPTDMFTLYEYHKARNGEAAAIPAVIGYPAESEEGKNIARDMSPLLIAEEGKAYPPTLILHGDCDTVVPYESQGVRMYERLCELGCDTEMVCVEGADHEGSFWSDELHDIAFAFLNRYLKK